jgi:hypothetical protein
LIVYRLPLTALATIALLLPLRLIGLAQEVTASSLKAAYIYNFARFTDWPDDSPTSQQPLVICVLGDAAVGDALEQVVKGRQLSGRAVIVSRVAAGRTPGCHVLYISSPVAAEVSQVVAAVQDSPVLTIGDAVNFTKAGGVAQLFFDRGQLHFNISRQAIKRARLQIHSRLLALAHRYE